MANIIVPSKLTEKIIEDLYSIAEFLRVDIRDLPRPNDWGNNKGEQFEKK